MDRTNKIFISYSHKNKAWVKNWLLPKLENAGVQTHIDYRDFEIGVPSLINMEQAVEECAKTIMVLTPHYVQSEFTQFEAIMLQTDDPIGVRKKILPLILEACLLPKRMKMFTYADFKDPDRRESEFARLVHQIENDFAAGEPSKPVYPPLAKTNIDVHRLPYTGYELLGRQKELQFLNAAWASDDVNIVAFVAYGGVGKSTLLNKWSERMRWDNYHGAQKVFAWSFYSQGTNELVTSADQFIDHALRWFGDPNPAWGSAWDKGERLAELIRWQKTLLLLDGLEPLQSTFEFEAGKIKDPALSTLMTALAKRNNGLCVITTRENVYEMARYPDTCQQINLEKLSDEAGTMLLRLNRVEGTEEELQAATRTFGNHALAINLLAAYLHGTSGHHISHAAYIPGPEEPEAQAKHPWRVMAAFAQRFGDGPETELLHALGLFQHPATRTAIAAITAAPVIAGLTTYLHKLDEADFLKLCNTLRTAKLLVPQSHHTPDLLDCHPLVREYFGERLRTGNPVAWKAAHSRLYEYYKNLPKKELPDTLEEMEPLFAAVEHGCLSGRYTEVWEVVYEERINRGDEDYCIKKLGAFGADLAALSSFFETPWSQPATGLSDHEQALVLNYAGFALVGLGRLREAAKPMQVGLEAHITQENWKEAAIDARNLSELYLTLGKVKQAVDIARQSVDFADRSGVALERYSNRTVLANVLHYTGYLSEAESLLREAEAMQKERQPNYPYLYSIRGFRFCDLLLSQEQFEEVVKRTNQTIEIALQKGDLLSIALDKLSLGRAYLLEAQKNVNLTSLRTKALQQAEDWLIQAVAGLREAGQQDDLPLGLLTRAALYRVQGASTKARDDLEEAQEIAERGSMNLHLTDYHLESCRLCLAESKQKAKKHLAIAKEMIEQMGYGRRKPEVKKLEAMVNEQFFAK